MKSEQEIRDKIKAIDGLIAEQELDEILLKTDKNSNILAEMIVENQILQTKILKELLNWVLK